MPETSDLYRLPNIEILMLSKFYKPFTLTYLDSETYPPIAGDSSKIRESRPQEKSIFVPAARYL